jgi:8-oxo-dGTP diphosphatase
MKLLKIVNPERVSEEEIQSYPVREAARAIVTDGEGNIALLHVAHEQYYKLPGGGLEGAEDKIVALRRECQEEIGCDIEVTSEIGTIIEYRKIFNLKQISYCYFARVKGEKGTPDFTTEEKEKGFEALWVPYADALQLMRGSGAMSFEGESYIVPRDIAFLEAVKDLM